VSKEDEIISLLTQILKVTAIQAAKDLSITEGEIAKVRGVGQPNNCGCFKYISRYDSNRNGEFAEEGARVNGSRRSN
jgi:hypothetical protein